MRNGWSLIGAGSLAPDEIDLIAEAAALDPSFAQRVGYLLEGAATGAAADYQLIDPLTIAGSPSSVKAGNPITLYLKATVKDTNGGINDHWQIVVAAAEVNAQGALVTGGLRNSGTIGSGIQLYSNTLYLRDNSPGSSQYTMQLGAMPNPAKTINYAVELFANHSDTPVWDWSLWQ